MNRREFLLKLGEGVAAGWAVAQLSPLNLGAVTPAWGKSLLRVAYLADTHLVDGDDRRPQARALARAVAEIKALDPVPDLVFFGGDLAHQGNPEGLALGKGLLDDLPAPVLLVMGEQDGYGQQEEPWVELFGEPYFSFDYQGVHFFGLHTAWRADANDGRIFRIEADQLQWLRDELTRLPSSTPLVVFSHAPLYKLYKPWHFWTEGAEAVQALLSPYEQVTLVHGHVHQDVRIQYAGLAFQGMRATAWPLPDVREGTPFPVTAPPRDLDCSWQGCGWGLLTIAADGKVARNDHVWMT
jgi:hypothetical protein